MWGCEFEPDPENKGKDCRCLGAFYLLDCQSICSLTLSFFSGVRLVICMLLLKVGELMSSATPGPWCGLLQLQLSLWFFPDVCYGFQVIEIILFNNIDVL